MAIGQLKAVQEKKQEGVKKPEGFDEMIMSKAMAKLYKNKRQFDNSGNTRRGYKTKVD